MHYVYTIDRSDIDAAVSRVSEEVSTPKKLAQLLGNQATTLDSAKWTKDINELNNVVTWLGFDEACKFQKLMELNTAGSPVATHHHRERRLGSAYGHTKTNVHIDTSCRSISRQSKEN